jgi:hypothetical protein
VVAGEDARFQKAEKLPLASLVGRERSIGQFLMYTVWRAHCGVSKGDFRVPNIPNVEDVRHTLRNVAAEARKDPALADRLQRDPKAVLTQHGISNEAQEQLLKEIAAKKQRSGDDCFVCSSCRFSLGFTSF